MGKKCTLKPREAEGIKARIKTKGDRIKKPSSIYDICLYDIANYGRNLEKGSGDVVSAVCYTLYTIYLSICK